MCVCIAFIEIQTSRIFKSSQPFKFLAYSSRPVCDLLWAIFLVESKLSEEVKGIAVILFLD